MESYKKQATSLEEVDFAVRHDIPVGAKHPYFVDFSGVRGNFEEKRIYKAFNVRSDFTYDYKLNQHNKTLLFLGGMRGSGKTSEIAKYVSKLENPECFFCIVCNIDKELDTNDVEYMDILILQIEKLLKKAKEKNLKLDDEILKELQQWFSKRVKHANRYLESKIDTSIETKAGVPPLISFLNFSARIRAGITGSRKTASQIRTELKHNFTDFARLLNDFIEKTNEKIRKQRKGQELFFVIDGIEKTMSAETRKKIIIDESNRLQHIKANILFTLPIELMPKIQKLKMFSHVATFPFVKVTEKDGTPVLPAIEKFKEFTGKRIKLDLFDNQTTIEKAIIYSGGSPRELLRIYEEALFHADEKKGKITLNDLNKAIEVLAAECSHYLTSKDLELLKDLEEKNQQGKQVPYDEGWDKLLEHLIVLEYNDGTYKRVNPIVEASEIYKQYVKQ